MHATPGIPLRRRMAPVALGVLAFAVALTRSHVEGSWYGLYLLDRQGHTGVSLHDDLLFGERPRLLFGVSFAPLRAIAHAGDRLAGGGAYLEAEWNEGLGRGLVRNYLGDGSELDTFLSRWDNGGADGGGRHGVFVGGSIPDVAETMAQSNRSGMAFRTRRGQWRHVWCNANEAMWDVDGGREIDTWQYEFRGSRVLEHDATRFVVTSSHEVVVAGVPLRMRRTAEFVAGRPFLVLDVVLQNVGDRPVRYSFLYGDEPWVGNFGSSYGNLGWTEEGIFADEARIDARRLRAAGLVDTNTGTANFLAWARGLAPDVVYVSNELGVLRPGTPLASNEIFIGTEWRDRTLGPGEVQRIQLAIGMASRGRAGRLRVPEGVFEADRPASVTSR